MVRLSPETRGVRPRGQRSGAFRAALLAVGAGSAFGLTAALTKGMTDAFSRGMAVVMTSWQLYAMIVTGIAAMFLVQSAMNARRLVAAQPGLTLTDPLVPILWGVLAFRERVRVGWFLALAVGGGVIVVGAALVLARSPLLSGESGEREQPRRGLLRSAARSGNG